MAVLNSLLALTNMTWIVVAGACDWHVCFMHTSCHEMLAWMVAAKGLQQFQNSVCDKPCHEHPVALVCISYLHGHGCR